MLIHPASLSETVNATNTALFNGATLPASDRHALTAFILSRHALPNAYANTFAPFDTERTRGIKLFTGEPATSASARHILGQECCRLLLLLGPTTPKARAALASATQSLHDCLVRSETNPGSRHFRNPGGFCCPKCTVGVWRHLTAGGLDRPSERLSRGAEILRSARTPDGGWKGYPFWYTVSALLEADALGIRESRIELHHAAPKLKSALKRAPQHPPANPFPHLRRELAQRALA